VIRCDHRNDIRLDLDEEGKGGDITKAPTWLLVIEEKRKMAEGRERKNDCAAASRKFPILDHKDESRNRCMLRAHLPFTNEKFLCARRRISLSKYTRKPVMRSHMNKEEETE
jgi:hypothetical protein